MKNIRKYFENFSLLDPVSVSGLTVYPISFENASVMSNLRSFDDLYDEGKVQALEVGESGLVERINLKNESLSDLLLLDGEAIIGAKQNRISERTVILQSNSETQIPVNCVERGRWQFDEDVHFSKSNFSASPRMKSRKAELLNNDESHKVQDTMWGEIDELSVKLNASSATHDLGEVLRSRENRLRDIDFDKILKDPCNGYLVLGTDNPFIELYHDKEVCVKQIRKSLVSWVADAERSKVKTEFADPNFFINKFLDTQWQQDHSIGIENSFKSSSSNTDCHGRAVTMDDNFVHSNFFFNIFKV